MSYSVCSLFSVVEFVLVDNLNFLIWLPSWWALKLIHSVLIILYFRVKYNTQCFFSVNRVQFFMAKVQSILRLIHENKYFFVGLFVYCAEVSGRA